MPKPATIANYLKQILLLLIFLCLAAGAFSFVYMENGWYEPGELLGRVAIILLWVSCLPGILKRLQVQGFLRQLQTVLMICRRRIGVLMFLTAVLHVLWLRWFGYILYGPPDPSRVQLYETFGVISLFLLVPLFITSNNFAVKMLKGLWQKIHYLVYAVMWFVTLHVSYQDRESFLLYGIPTIIIILLQIYSWYKVWTKKQGKPSTLQA